MASYSELSNFSYRELGHLTYRDLQEFSLDELRTLIKKQTTLSETSAQALYSAYQAARDFSQREPELNHKVPFEHLSVKKTLSVADIFAILQFIVAVLMFIQSAIEQNRPISETDINVQQTFQQVMYIKEDVLQGNCDIDTDGFDLEKPTDKPQQIDNEVSSCQ